MITELGQVIESLLSGRFICKVSDEQSFEFLSDDGNRAAVEKQLAVLNRRLASAADAEVYYCAYQVLGETERKQLTQQFQETSMSLMPLVEWLLLVQEAQGTDIPLAMGTSVRMNELQVVIEDTPALAEQLAKIARYKLFGSQSSELDAQLKQVFKRLVELGYLTKPNPEKQLFIVTGKVDYLFDVIKFIDETENLALASQAEEAMAQASLI